MIISGVIDENCGCNVRSRSGAGDETSEHDYQTADRLFEIFTRNECTTRLEGDTPSKRDVFFLYKNRDMGKEEPSNCNELKCRPNNQYVETVVYKDDSDDSDLSQNCSNEDLISIFEVNSERIDFFSKIPSGNALCNKLGNIELQSSFLMSDYCIPFLKDPFAKDPYDNINLLSKIENLNVLPTSLIDYIACKRMEDNFHFCMDDIIRYVQYTIEQLKRISNGDFLTDPVKEKWLQVENGCAETIKNDTVLTTCTRLPLHVERKTNGTAIKWDDLVKSDVDVKTLSKVIEKKIVEVPQLLQGSFKMFSKRCGDNLIIRFKADNAMKSPLDMLKDSRIDVILNLRRSTSGRVISDITSTMILKRPLSGSKGDLTKARLTLPPIKAAQIEEGKNTDNTQDATKENMLDSITKVFADKDLNGKHRSSDSELSNDENYCSEKDRHLVKQDSPNAPQRDHIKKSQRFLEKISSDHKPEEIGGLEKKTSEPRIRYKSPYENKSHLIEERKRRRLLEIRDRREKRKQALEMFGQIFKNSVLNKGFSKPQSSNSVTTLSITNKAFYNSIYGLNDATQKPYKKDKRLNKTEDSSDETDYSSLCTEINESKYINRSFYLDEIETGIMQTECKTEVDLLTMSGDSTTGHNKSLKKVKHLKPREIKNNNKTAVLDNELRLTNSPAMSTENVSYPVSQSEISKCDNQDKDDDDDDDDDDTMFSDESPEKITPLKFRKSIDKIYGLLKKFDNNYTKNSSTDMKITISKSAFQNTELDNTIGEDNISKKNPKRKPDPNDLDQNTYGLKTTFDKNIVQVRPISKVHINSMISKLNANPDIQLPKTTEDSTVDNIFTKETSIMTQELDKVLKRRNKIGEKRVDQAKPTPITSKVSKSSKLIAANFPRVDKQLLNRKLIEITDEQREARGEAVRGPPISSRLDELAQPKKSYLMATKEELLNKPPKSDRQRRSQKPRRMSFDSEVRQTGTMGKKPGVDSNVLKTERTMPTSPSALPQNLLRHRGRMPPVAAAAVGRQPSPQRPYKKPAFTSPDNLNNLNIEGKPLKGNKKRSSSPKKKTEIATKPYIDPKMAYQKKTITSDTHSSFSSLLSALDSAVQHYNIKEDTTDILSTTFENAEYQDDIDENDINSSKETCNITNHVNIRSEFTNEEQSTNDKQNVINKHNSSETHKTNDKHKISGSSNVPKNIEANEDFAGIETYGVVENLNQNEKKEQNIKRLCDETRDEIEVQKRLESSGDHQLDDVSTSTSCQVAVMHSGDAASVLLKSKILNSLKKSSLSELTSLSKLSHLSWSMSNIPTQLSTIGYVFNTLKDNSSSKKVKISNNSSLIKFNNVSRVRIQNFTDQEIPSAKNIARVGNYKTKEKNNDDIISRRYEHGAYVKISRDGIDIGINTSSLGITNYNNKAESLLRTKQPVKAIMELVPSKAVSSPSIVETLQTKVETMSTLVNPEATIVDSISTFMGPIHTNMEHAKKYKNITNYNESAQCDESTHDNSLDILVGLLTEIQNITHSCHISITKPLSQISPNKSSNYELDSIFKDNRLNTQTCLPVINRSPSVISIYVSDNCKVSEKATSITSINLKPPEVKQIIKSFEDKAISAYSESLCRFNRVEFDKKCQDNLDKESTTSLYSCNYYQPEYDTSCIDNSVSIVELSPEEITQDTSLINNSTSNIDVTETTTDMSETTDADNEEIPVYTKKLKIVDSSKQRKLVPVKYCRLKSHVKMKRDILVTVYSILVVTVFAALSFPGLI